MIGFGLVSEVPWHFGLIFMRIGGAVSFLPGFGERFLPMRVRLAAGFSISYLVLALGLAPLPAASVQFSLGAMIVELCVGVALGIALRMFLFAVQIAGSIAAQSTSLAQIYGGQAVEPLPAIGHLLTLGALALIMMSGYTIQLLACLGEFYDFVPLGTLIPADGFLEWSLSLVATTFKLGFILAAPFMLSSVLYNLAIGLINKAMPQMMVAFVGAPFITFLSLVLLALTVPVMLSVWRTEFFSFLLFPTQVSN